MTRLYVVTSDHCDGIDIVAATDSTRARLAALLDDSESEAVPYIDLQAKLLRVSHKPVEVNPTPCAWTDSAIAPLLRDLGYSYGEFPEGDRCEPCGLDSFAGWDSAPENWAICGSCFNCGDCSSEYHAENRDPDDRCSDCGEVAAAREAFIRAIEVTDA